MGTHEMKSLLITGIFRSGTTLLTRALATHDQVATAYQPFSPFFKAWRNLIFRDILQTPIDFKAPMGKDYFVSGEDRERFVKCSLEAHFDATDLEQIKKEVIANLDDDPHERLQAIAGVLGDLKAGPAHALIPQLFAIVQRCYPEKPVVMTGIKELWCEEFILPLRYGFQTRGIQLIRDPRAVFASRNTGKHLQSCGGKKYPVLFVARAWRRSFQYGKGNQDPSHFFWVRFEDLVREPERIMKELCHMLEVEFQPSMVEPARFLDGGNNPWIANSTASARREFNVTTVDQWEKFLNPEETGVIEFLCRAEMEALGYQPRYPDFGIEEFLRYRENESEITEWLKNSEFTLNNQQKELEITHAQRGKPAGF